MPKALSDKQIKFNAALVALFCNHFPKEIEGLAEMLQEERVAFICHDTLQSVGETGFVYDDWRRALSTMIAYKREGDDDGSTR